MIPSAETLRRAGEILQEIEQLRNELSGLFGGGGAPSNAAPATKRAKTASIPASSAPAAGKKRNMSPEARARIAAAARARWAKYRADKKSAK